MNWGTIVSLVISFIALGVTLRKEFFLVPQIEYSSTELTEYPRSDNRLSLSVTRAEVGESVQLKYGLTIHIRSTGREPATNIQARITPKDGAVIVQAHTDESSLVEKLSDIGRQGSPEVFVNIPLMVPDEGVKFTFWYGVPGAVDKQVPIPTILIRHSKGLGKAIKSS
jgi:hypothetical protein